jgi:hypothetical protein
MPRLLWRQRRFETVLGWTDLTSTRDFGQANGLVDVGGIVAKCGLLSSMQKSKNEILAVI